ncbi:MAG TPA: hypothetical protein VM901_05140 [Bdellovibrionota bacterium]|jgi:hypothetical protein|nr:hypothetical protein [Bdellovibrionota bacterium]
MKSFLFASLIALSLSTAATAAPCHTPVAYGCLKEDFSQKTCIDYFDSGSAVNNQCASDETFMPEGCTSHDRVGSCEVSFMGTELLYHTYLPANYNLAARNCARLDGVMCEAL